ncbi:MAG: XRE family transcriptional regulator [Clostridia bacterium]|nr:helix-turn-helix domain-containing protein [Oscillospiraceae bacterium]MBS5433975.1 helix-turn-helix domain-containing protein [Bacillota bacterium]PWM15796.1 MAG: XRE family transcriptional regulator [Clostridia bacterium]
MKIYWNGDSKNIIGNKVRMLRIRNGLTQEALAAKLQLNGFNFSALTILRIENGTRFVPDYEVKALSEIFNVCYEELLD